MDMISRSNTDVESPEPPSGLSRRAVLMTAAVAASAVAGVSPALADTGSANFGAPLVEVYVPPGVLTLEQRAAMIKGVTDVVLKATKLSDPARKSFVQIVETADGGFGVNGQVFVPRGK